MMIGLGAVGFGRPWPRSRPKPVRVGPDALPSVAAAKDAVPAANGPPIAAPSSPAVPDPPVLAAAAPTPALIPAPAPTGPQPTPPAQPTAPAAHAATTVSPPLPAVAAAKPAKPSPPPKPKPPLNNKELTVALERVQAQLDDESARVRELDDHLRDAEARISLLQRQMLGAGGTTGPATPSRVIVQAAVAVPPGLLPPPYQVAAGGGSPAGWALALAVLAAAHMARGEGPRVGGNDGGWWDAGDWRPSADGNGSGGGGGRTPPPPSLRRPETDDERRAREAADRAEAAADAAKSQQYMADAAAERQSAAENATKNAAAREVATAALNVELATRAAAERQARAVYDARMAAESAKRAAAEEMTRAARAAAEADRNRRAAASAAAEAARRAKQDDDRRRAAAAERAKAVKDEGGTLLHVIMAGDVSVSRPPQHAAASGAPHTPGAVEVVITARCLLAVGELPSRRCAIYPSPAAAREGLYDLCGEAQADAGAAMLSASRLMALMGSGPLAAAGGPPTTHLDELELLHYARLAQVCGEEAARRTALTALATCERAPGNRPHAGGAPYEVDVEWPAYPLGHAGRVRGLCQASVRRVALGDARRALATLEKAVAVAEKMVPGRVDAPGSGGSWRLEDLSTLGSSPPAGAAPNALEQWAGVVAIAQHVDRMQEGCDPAEGCPVQGLDVVESALRSTVDLPAWKRHGAANVAQAARLLGRSHALVGVLQKLLGVRLAAGPALVTPTAAQETAAAAAAWPEERVLRAMRSAKAEEDAPVPERVWALTNSAGSLAMTGAVPRARELYERAITIKARWLGDPDHPALLAEMAALAALLGRLPAWKDDAARVWTQIARILAAVASEHVRKGEPREALAVLAGLQAEVSPMLGTDHPAVRAAAESAAALPGGAAEGAGAAAVAAVFPEGVVPGIAQRFRHLAYLGGGSRAREPVD